MRGSCHLDKLLNVEIGVKFCNVYFFKGQLLCNFCKEIIQPFLDLEGAPLHNNIKKHSNKNNLTFNTNYNIQRPVQMT